MLPDSGFKSQSVPNKIGSRNESNEREARFNDRTESENRRRSVKETKSVIGRIAETISSVVRGKSKEKLSVRQGKNQESANSDGSNNNPVSDFKPTSMFSLMGEKAIG